jgi:hypothetical protein
VQHPKNHPRQIHNSRKYCRGCRWRMTTTMTTMTLAAMWSTSAPPPTPRGRRHHCSKTRMPPRCRHHCRIHRSPSWCRFCTPYLKSWVIE